ncbi:hypothetical protein MTO96_029449 [Rhipicephalus appendiculatus]
MRTESPYTCAGRASSTPQSSMATAPVEETVFSEGASRGPTGDETGGGLDAANNCNSGGGAGCYEPAPRATALATPSMHVQEITRLALLRKLLVPMAPRQHRRPRLQPLPAVTGLPLLLPLLPLVARTATAGAARRALPVPSLRWFPPSVHYGVYVNNIPLDVEDDQLKALFKPYGEVLRMKLVRRPEFTSFLFAYVLLDSDDNTKRAIQELDGTVLNGQPLKMEPTFGRTTHIFGIGEGTPYNRSRAALEEWRQNRDARANGNRNNRQHDDQWRRGNNDRNYRQGDRRFGDWNNGYRRYGDRGNYNDHRHGGGGGYNRFGGYHQNNNQYNNRYDNNRNFSRRGGYHGDGGGGGHWQHGGHSFGGRNQGGGYRPADDGQWRQRGRGQNRYGDDFGRRGDGAFDGGNRSGEDDGYANYQVFQEARRKMRDAWTRRLERMAAEGNDEEWPTFDELLQLVRQTPYNIPTRDTADIDDEAEDVGGQPVFWWSRDSAAEGGGDGFGPAQAPRTVLELLRWRHGDEAVAEVFRNVPEEEESGGADGGKQAPREDSEDRDAVAVDNVGDGVRNAAVTDKRDKACLEQEQSSAERLLARGESSDKDEDGVSEDGSAGTPSTLSSSSDVSVDSLDLSAEDSREGPTEDDTLPSEFASRCSVSLPNLIEHAEDSSADGQANRQQPPRPSKAGDDKKDADVTEHPSRRVISAPRLHW